MLANDCSYTCDVEWSVITVAFSAITARARGSLARLDTSPDDILSSYGGGNKFPYRSFAICLSFRYCTFAGPRSCGTAIFIELAITARPGLILRTRFLIFGDLVLIMKSRF